MDNVRICFFHDKIKLSIYVFFNDNLLDFFRNYIFNEDNFSLLISKINATLSSYNLKCNLLFDSVMIDWDTFVCDITNKTLLFPERLNYLVNDIPFCEYSKKTNDFFSDLWKKSEFLLETNYEKASFIYLDFYKDSLIYYNNKERLTVIFKERIVNNDNIELAITLYKEALYSNYQSLIDNFNEVIQKIENNNKTEYSNGLDEYFIKYPVLKDDLNKYELEIINNYFKIYNPEYIYLAAYRCCRNEKLLNKEIAYRLMIKAAEKGSINALYFIGTVYQKEYLVIEIYKNHYIRFNYILKKISKNKSIKYFVSPEALKYCETIKECIYLMELSDYYANEKIFKPNYKNAVKPLKTAIKNNFTPAMLKLANYYFEGKILKKSYSKAFKLYKKAFRLQNKKSFFYLGFCYENGLGVEKNYKKAIKYYEKGASYNCEKSINRLNSIKKQGVYKKIKYMTKIENEIYQIANDYFLGKEVLQNYKKAFKLYFNAFKKGVIQASYNIAICYENGFGVQKDIHKAIDYYKISIETNNIDSMINLAKIYYYGNGIEEDKKTAVELFEKCVSIKNILIIQFLIKHFKTVDKNNEKVKKYIDMFEFAKEFTIKWEDKEDKSKIHDMNYSHNSKNSKWKKRDKK